MHVACLLKAAKNLAALAHPPGTRRADMHVRSASFILPDGEGIGPTTAESVVVRQGEQHVAV